jgi:hypothetical protein
MDNPSGRPLVGIGLGGIAEGWLPATLHFHQTGVMRFSRILLVDGKAFDSHHRSRQHFGAPRPKAVERCALWGAMYPDAPLRHLTRFVDRGNVAEIVGEGSIVMLSPDNHATRKVVSDHAETLRNVILICGGNDGIDQGRGEDGTEGCVMVHCKHDGTDLTPPITRHHKEIAEPEDRLPTDLGCMELAQTGEPQVLATNLVVGWQMVLMLYRYCTPPVEEAARIPEVWVNSRTNAFTPYGVNERP